MLGARDIRGSILFGRQLSWPSIGKCRTSTTIPFTVSVQINGLLSNLLGSPHWNENGWILSHCRICLDLPYPVLEATPKAIPGSTHSDPRTYSPTSSRRRPPPASPNIRSREWPVERIVQSRLIVSSPLCGGSLQGRWSHHMRNEVL